MPVSSDDFKLLMSTFREVFDMYSLESFKSGSKVVKWISDGAQGVQWNAMLDKDGGYLGVNLEGMEYKNWPIADFILNERDHPGLAEARELTPRPSTVTVIP